jgi:DNA-binding MarR family transcriptional regulator
VLVQNLKQYPAHFIRRIQQISTALFAQECGDLELTAVQYAALVAIQTFPSCDQSTISRMIGYDKVTMGKVLEKLEQRGWIERFSDPDNRRAKVVRIIASGEAIIEKVEPRVQALNDKIIEPLTAAEQNEFIRMLQKIVEAHNDASRAPVRGIDV